MELFKLFGTIALDNSEANRGIDNTVGKAKDAFKKIGDAAVAVGKTVAAGIGVAATAIATLTKQSLDSYAEYEQLIGGVETLYGATADSMNAAIAKFGEGSEAVEQLASRQDTVLANASNAYKTAGMSANDYMNTVNGFAASLTSSLGEYEWQAANYADMIVTDMSDNANKMGTSMDMIQNAYSGFAKQNYTMLDNLKLGYGGTKEEMERLLRDAEKMAGYIEGSLKIESFADIADAIHIIQEEMGITGTTAREASATIEGSLAMTKAAWQNLLVGFADDTQDLGALVTNLVDSAKTAVDNLMPRIQQILGGIVEFVRQMIPVISAELPVLLEELLPGLIEAATLLMTGLISALPQILQIFLGQVPFIVSEISGALVSAFPVLLDTVKTLFQQIWDYISLELLNTGVSFEDAFAKIEDIFEDTWNVLKSVWDSVGEPVFNLIQDLIGLVRDKFGEKMPEIKEFVSQCFEDIETFWNNNLKPCLDAIGNFIENVLAPVFELVFISLIGGAVDEAFNFIKELWNNTLKPVFTGITDFLTGIFTLNFSQAFEGLVSIIKGIWDGIVAVVKRPINLVIGIINNFIRGLNEIQVPDWVPLVGGNGINIPEIPMLAKGGVLERGQVGFLEGNGAEAVVPLDQNKKWISAVAADMNAAIGSDNREIRELKEIFRDFVDALPEMMIESFKAMKLDVNNREFARLVKAVN